MREDQAFLCVFGCLRQRMGNFQTGSEYGLVEQMAMGGGGMTDIIEAQWRADKVITI